MSESWSRPPFVGRDLELTILRSRLDEANDGCGGVLLVCGDAGIGKSRLVDQAMQDSNKSTVRFVTVDPYSIDRPFGPLLEGLSLRWREILPNHPSTPIDFQIDDLPHFLAAEAICEAFDVLVSDGGTTFVFDGLHWADDQTLRILAPLARQLRDLPVVLVCLTRLDPRVAPVVHAAEREGATVIRLDPVSVVEARELAVSCMGVDVDPSAVDDVVEAADGNPLMILATARVVGSSDTDALGAIVRTTYTAFDDNGIMVLRAAALLGRHIDVAEVAAVTGISERDVLAILESATASALITREPSGLLIRHDLLLDSMVAECPPLHAQMIHRSAARLLHAAGAEPHRISHHFLSAGLDRTAVDDLTGLAEAVVRSDPATALRIVDSVISAPPGGRLDRRLLMVRVQALAAVGRADEAAQQSLLLIAQGVEPHEEAALRRELALSALVRGDAGRAAEEMARVGALATHPGARGRALGELAMARLVLRDATGAAPEAIEAFEAARVSGDLITDICATSVLLMHHLLSGDRANATAMFEHLEALVEVPGAVDASVYQPHLFLTMYLRDVGRHADAIRVASEGLAMARRSGQVWPISAFDGYLAQLSLDSGSLSDARAHATAALEGSARIDPLGVALWAAGLLTHIAVLEGDRPEIERMSAHAEQLLADGRIGLGAEAAVLALVRAKEFAGDSATALQYLDIGVTLFAAMPAVPALGVLDIDVARHRSSDGARSDVWSTTGLKPMASPLDDARRSADRALDSSDPASIAEAIATLDRVGARREALELGWMTLRGRPLSERSLRWREVERAVAALAAACDATSVKVDLGGNRHRPSRRGASDLTRAEQLVADLIALGLSNSDIAGRLQLSRRTVESHCSAMYRKLGVTNRVQVARLLLARPEDSAR